MGLRPNLAFGLKPPLAGLTFFVGLAVTIFFLPSPAPFPVGLKLAGGGAQAATRAPSPRIGGLFVGLQTRARSHRSPQQVSGVCQLPVLVFSSPPASPMPPFSASSAGDVHQRLGHLRWLQDPPFAGLALPPCLLPFSSFKIAGLFQSFLCCTELELCGVGQGQA